MCPNHGMLINILPALSNLVCNVGLCCDNEPYDGVSLLYKMHYGYNFHNVRLSGIEMDL